VGESEHEFSAGVFLVDKPGGVTSFSIVRQIRRLLRMKKVGHAGTLDPFATGLLIVCAGRPATRLIGQFMAGKKAYSAVLQLGVETATMDPEGQVVKTVPVPVLERETIERCLAGFRGRTMQSPPPYSAVKHMGKPLYHYARKGITVVKEPRAIEIYSLDCRGYDAENNRLAIDITCSRGTYIRVLASDIGNTLGCGAHLVGLRRFASGVFSLHDSLSGDCLSGPEGLRELMSNMIPVEKAMTLLRQQEFDGFEAKE